MKYVISQKIIGLSLFVFFSLIAFGTNNVWAETITVLDSAGSVGEYTSIAIGSDGNPVISYFDSTNDDLRVVHCTDASCSTQDNPVIVDSVDDVGFFTSIAIGSDGNPMISYYDSTNDDLKVVHCTDVSCSTQDAPVIVESVGSVGEYTSMAIGSDGNPVVSYYDSTNGDLKVVHCTDVSCSTQDTPLILDGVGDVGFFTSIAIGSDNNPVISYFDSTNDDLRVIRCADVSCSTQDTPVTLDSVGNVGFYSSIVIGGDDNPVISYIDSTNDDLRVIRCADVSCSTHDTSVIVDSIGDVGFFTSIVIGVDNNPVISYYDLSNGDLKMARCTSSTCNLFDNPWGEGLTLDSVGDVGFYTSIAIGNDDNPVISYYDFTNDDLKVVHCTDVSCFTQDTPITLDNVGDVGNYTSIAIGSDDYPMVSYFDSTNGDLKVVHCTDISCSTQDTPGTLDSLGSVGNYTSIAIGSDDNPVISYYDSTNGDLKVVHCTDVSCSTQDTPVILDGIEDNGFYQSITIGNDGNPIISYYDLTNGDLKVVHCTDVSCSTQDTPIILDSTGDVGEYTSIAIGNDGNPMISYYDFTNGNLKVVHCRNHSCSINDSPLNLDSLGNMGFYTSITFTRNNFPIISYFDGTNDDLKVITQIETCAPTGLGTWIIDEDCYLNSNANPPENVVVQNNSTLTIASGNTLDVDFEEHNITINSGSTILVKLGGSIN